MCKEFILLIIFASDGCLLPSFVHESSLVDYIHSTPDVASLLSPAMMHLVLFFSAMEADGLPTLYITSGKLETLH